MRGRARKTFGAAHIFLETAFIERGSESTLSADLFKRPFRCQSGLCAVRRPLWMLLNLWCAHTMVRASHRGAEKDRAHEGDGYAFATPSDNRGRQLASNA